MQYRLHNFCNVYSFTTNKEAWLGHTISFKYRRFTSHVNTLWPTYFCLFTKDCLPLACSGGSPLKYGDRLQTIIPHKSSILEYRHQSPQFTWANDQSCLLVDVTLNLDGSFISIPLSVPLLLIYVHFKGTQYLLVISDAVFRLKI